METVLERPYAQTKKWVRASLKTDTSMAERTALMNACEFPVLETIPPGSAAIIGHAYGRPGNPHGFVAANVESFIKDHASQLDDVIFSGDVLAEPNVEKWNRLASLSDETGITFHIAPGNHDVGHGDNAKRDIWNATQFGFVEGIMPPLDIAGFTVFIEDSVREDWQMAPVVINALQDAKTNKPILLVRHNIAIAEMSVVANSLVGLTQLLPNQSALSERLPPNTTVVSGDSGAFPHLPRLACSSQNDVQFVANGIGETGYDVLLILSGGEIYQLAI